ncbi:hypothetical protein BKA63DRAFT_202685 [Paraphoma chrysanthemicola]|nr:hypothetical protein BKA63DRAFT_202685 [Paraphoma chrysanthemicola]
MALWFMCSILPARWIMLIRVQSYSPFMDLLHLSASLVGRKIVRSLYSLKINGSADARNNIGRRTVFFAADLGFVMQEHEPVPAEQKYLCRSRREHDSASILTCPGGLFSNGLKASRGDSGRTRLWLTSSPQTMVQVWQ